MAQKAPTPPTPDRLIDCREVSDQLGTSTTSVWRWCHSRPGFPQPIKVGPLSTRWKQSEVSAYVAALGAKEPSNV